jgi:hypothetical protein
MRLKVLLWCKTERWRNGTRALLASVTLALMVADAAAYCSEPDAPYCASRFGPFEDEDEFNRCKREMESYRSDVEELLDCLRDESEDLKRQGDNAANEYDDAVQSFNRRARAD